MRGWTDPGFGVSDGSPVFIQSSGAAIKIGTYEIVNKFTEGPVVFCETLTSTQEEVDIDWLAYSPDLKQYEVNGPGLRLPMDKRLDEFAWLGLDNKLLASYYSLGDGLALSFTRAIYSLIR